MLPKEKAKELVKKYSDIQIEIGSEYEGYLIVKILQAKQCALISVDEILIEYPSQCPKDSYEMVRHLYWQEVKQEIEKL